MRKHGTSGAFDKEDAGQEREMKEAERSAPSGGGAPAEGGAAPAKKRSALKIVCAAVLALILLLGAFAAGWLGSCFSTDPRLRELEWLLETLEKEHYRDTDMDAVYEELYQLWRKVYAKQFELSEAGVTKSMWLLAQPAGSFAELQRRFYRQVNFDTFYH